MGFTGKHILDMESLSIEEIEQILDTADNLKEISERPIKKVPTLRGKTVILFFYEPSTRTRTSFDIAAKRLSADSISISASTSSVVMRGLRIRVLPPTSLLRAISANV